MDVSQKQDNGIICSKSTVAHTVESGKQHIDKENGGPSAHSKEAGDLDRASVPSFLGSACNHAAPGIQWDINHSVTIHLGQLSSGINHSCFCGDVEQWITLMQPVLIARRN